MRYFWLGLGWISVALGIAGIPLPLLPTTPFLLLAAFAFGKSSPRFHAWLVNHPRLGPGIRNWQERRAISPKAKVMAMVALLAALGISLATGVDRTILIVQVAVMVAVASFILTRNSA